MATETMIFNGVDGATGRYLLPPVTPADIAALARGEPLGVDDKEIEGLTAHARRQKLQSFRVAAGVDPRKIEDAGWGILFPRFRGGGTLDGRDAAAHARHQAAIREALAPLIEHRRNQATRIKAQRFRALTVDVSLAPDGSGRLRTESKHGFFDRQDPPVDGNAAVDPDVFPYYLLIVGSPAEISYRFQYQLDVQYAVGRLHFDTVDDYARYAQSVVAAETSGLSLGRRMALWGPRTPGDRATELSSEHLLTPLSQWLTKTLFAEPGFAEHPWTLDSDDIGHGTHARLAELLGGDRTPALLLTASHGLYYPQSHPWHRSHTGALLCQDWTPGTPPTEDHLFAAADLPADARLAGLVAFHFACYGAGVPARDSFEHYEKGTPDAQRAARALAASPFVSPLPRRMLAHPGGGALAVIGHVDRAWGSSFYKHGRRSDAAQLSVFQSTLRALLEGYPVGCAMDYFNERYAATTSDIANAISAYQQDGYSDQYEDDYWMADRWLESSDARNYAVLGDPAVRLCAGDGGGPQRLELGPIPELRAAEPAPAAEPAAEPAVAGPPPYTPPNAAFGFWDWGKDKDDDAADGEREPGLIDRLKQTLTDLATDLTTLEVCTYTAAEVDGGKRQIGEVGELRAWTRMRLDGDTHTCVPLVRGKVDSGLWAVHEAMVERAQAHRTEMLKTLIGAVSGVWSPAKK